MILFFDTETTGLPKKWKAPVTDLDNWPRLVQLAYLVYDFDGNLIHSCNEIIKPIGFTIPMDASKVHGITTELASQRGSEINHVFELFLIHLKRSKLIVAHNMTFDEKIIGSELIRLGLDNILDSKEKICTMESTVDLCKIDGPYGYKWPKLEELYRYLFNHDFEGAHDALADIQATAKCFWELKNRGFNKVKYPQNSQNFNSIVQQLNKHMLASVNKQFDVPFLKIDELGSSTWQCYNTKAEIYHGEIFNDHYSIEKEISNMKNALDLWSTTYCVIRQGELLGLGTWNGWTSNEDGDLFFEGNYKLNIFDLNLNIKYVDGDPIFRIVDSEKEISKLIAYCQDGDEDGWINDWYETLFYINDKGYFYLENKQLPQKEFDIFDAYEAIAEFDAENNAFDQDFYLIP